ncbi:MAG: metallophosphoesterase family protein [Bacteroidales bacterium]
MITYTRTRIFITALLLLGLSKVTAAQDHIHSLEPDTEPIHLRVLFEQDPSSNATISWTTTEEGSFSVVYYDTEPRNGNVGDYRFKSENVRTGAYSLRSEEKEAGMESWYHHAELEDLEPSTTYYIVAETEGDRTDEYHFITAAEDDRDIGLLVGGDSRIGDQRTDPDNPRRQMNKVMCGLLEENPQILALMHSADYTNRAYWSQLYYWLKDHTEMTTTEDGRLLPIIPSRGNHDLDVGFEEMFNWPGEDGVDTYFTSSLSDQVSLIVLNTEISLGGDQRIWLDKQLSNLRPHKRWIMPVYHRTSYPSVRSYQSGEGRRLNWVSLFEKYNVDLVGEGHDHSLKRTVPIRGNEMRAEGIVYIGDGGLGVAPRDVVSDRWYLQKPGMAESVHNVHMLEFKKDEIHGRGFSIDSEVLDEFFIPADHKERIEYYKSLF